MSNAWLGVTDAPAPATVAALLRWAAERLAAAGVETPAREARLLLAHALGTTQEGLLRDRGAAVDAALLAPLLARRAAREPLDFILGHRAFWTLDLEVSPATLVPRADSEALIEAALDAFPDRARVRRVLDLGTGTGCLALAALSEFPGAWGLGIDIAPDAAALAARNARRNGLDRRAAFLCADWDAALAPLPGAARFDLVLSNPPYVASDEIPSLMPEVARHEPLRALDGGADGLDAYRRILAALPGLLEPVGIAILELGQGQRDGVSALAVARGLVIAGARPDLSGIDRALVLHSDGADRARPDIAP